ncbi:MAG: hypothetical protein NC911_07560 [Candidatus Omnitrophica bacterium]|nr:hypothetical protein [Candidatus Omnitrophota bacterium]
MKKVTLFFLSLGILTLGVPAFTLSEEKPEAKTSLAETGKKKDTPAAETVTGVVSKIDKEAGTFELTAETETTSRVFKARPKLLNKLAVNEKVAVHYLKTKSGENKALAVKKADGEKHRKKEKPGK